MKTIKIAGVSHEVIEVPVIAGASDGVVQGEITYSTGVILIKEDLPEDIKKEVLFHEIVHGILNHIGRAELRDDEDFVQALANGLYNSSLEIIVKEIKKDEV